MISFIESGKRTLAMYYSSRTIPLDLWNAIVWLSRIVTRLPSMDIENNIEISGVLSVGIIEFRRSSGLLFAADCGSQYWALIAL